KGNDVVEVLGHDAGRAGGQGARTEYDRRLALCVLGRWVGEGGVYQQFGPLGDGAVFEGFPEWAGWGRAAAAPEGPGGGGGGRRGCTGGARGSAGRRGEWKRIAIGRASVARQKLMGEARGHAPSRKRDPRASTSHILGTCREPVKENPTSPGTNSSPR